MKDIYIPKKVPRIEVREKLHGHTQILLRSVKTGRVERIESDNSFTDGIDSYIRDCGMYQNCLFQTNAANNPYWQYILGGIFLFDNALPTSPQARYMPAGTTMTANGSFGLANSGVPTELGSYNSVESTSSANSVSMVYDWTTSQGNGDIASVALTTQDGGYIGYGNASGGSASTKRSITANQSNVYSNLDYPTDNSSRASLYYNNTYYCCTSNSISSGATSITIKGKGIGLDEFDIFMNPSVSLANFPITKQINLPNALTDTCSVCVAGKAYPNCFALIPDIDVANGASFKVVFVNIATDEVTEKTITNNTGYTLGKWEGARIYFIDSTYAIVKCANDNGKVFKINYTNGTVVGEATNGTNTPYDYQPRTLQAGFLTDEMMQIGINSYLYDPTLNRFLITNGTLADKLYGYNYYPSDDLLMRSGGGTSQYFYPSVFKNPLRLMTINNLVSPVTKTADKTMKVTYTVTRSS